VGTLYVVATPIGNLEDVTVRAIKTLLTVETIACEDTRHTGQLLKILEERWAKILAITPVSHHYLSVRDWNEAEVVEKVLFQLQLGDVALVSDAGTPTISDPGFKVVRAVRAAGFTVSPIPGPNAAIAALSVSGLPTDKFVFLGFLPKKWQLYPSITNIIYEAPTRLAKTVKSIQQRYPRAQIVIASELTKIHEQIQTLGTTPLPTKGEHTILVSFAPSFLPESTD